MQCCHHVGILDCGLLVQLSTNFKCYPGFGVGEGSGDGTLFICSLSDENNFNLTKHNM